MSKSRKKIDFTAASYVNAHFLCDLLEGKRRRLVIGDESDGHQLRISFNPVPKDRQKGVMIEIEHAHFIEDEAHQQGPESAE